MNKYIDTDLRTTIPEESFFETSSERAKLKWLKDFGSRKWTGENDGYHDLYRRHPTDYHLYIDNGYLKSRMEYAVHSDPEIRAKVMRNHLIHRKAVYRNQQVNTSWKALDFTNEAHARWAAATELFYYWSIREVGEKIMRHDQLHLYNIYEPYSTPTGIPAPAIEPILDIDEQHYPHTLLLPDTTGYDVEHAAQVEIERYVGRATYMLRDMFPSNDPAKPSRTKNIARIHTYLTYYLQNIPFDPWDFDAYWGHNPRVKTLVLAEPFSAGGNAIALTPDFDPDVLEYTVATPIAQSTVKTIELVDPIVNLIKNSHYDYRINRENTVATLTATAYDGSTSRTYTFTVQE